MPVTAMCWRSPPGMCALPFLNRTNVIIPRLTSQLHVFLSKFGGEKNNTIVTAFESVWLFAESDHLFPFTLTLFRSEIPKRFFGF